MKSQPLNRSLQLRFGLFLLALLILLSLAVLFFFTISITPRLETRLLGPSASHLLGTDELGRGLVSCILCGLGISLSIGFGVTFLSALTGSILGMAAGFWGGVIDFVIMGIADIFLAFPGFLLAISLASFMGGGWLSLLIILTLSGWAGYARLARGVILKHKHMEFIQAAKGYNASGRRVLFSHFFLIIRPMLVVQGALGISQVIIAESSLNFLGIGLDPKLPTLGQMLETGRMYFFNAPRLTVAPAVVLFVLIMAFVFIGEGLRERYGG